MNVKDFFRLIIRLAALYFAFFGFTSLIESIVSLLLNNFVSLSLLWVFAFSFFYVLAFVILYFKTDAVLNFLNIEKGFEEKRFNFGNLNSKEIIKIALLFIGFSLFIAYIPEFISHCFYSFKYSTESKMYVDNSYKKDDYFRWTVSGVNIVIGYLIIFNHNKLSAWIDKKQE